LQGSGKRSLAYIAAAILVVGVLVSATLILVPLSRSPTTVTSTSTTTLTSTVTAVSERNSTVTVTSTSTAATDTVTLTSGSGQLGPWIRTTSYPSPVPPGKCVTLGEFIYCVGSQYSHTNETFFAPISSSGIGQWTRASDYPIPVEDGDCVGSSNYIYCVGGDSPSAQSTDPYGRIPSAYFAELSPSGIGNWTGTTPFPFIAASPRCLTYSSYIYCVELSFNGSGYTNPPEAFFAPLSAAGVGSWVQTVAPPSDTARCTAVGSHAYCFGGASCPPPGPCPSPTYSAPLSSSGMGNWSQSSELPTAGFANYVTAESYIYYLVTPTYVAQAFAEGVGPWQATTTYPDSAGACASSGAFVYCVSVSDNSSYYAEVGAPNPGAINLLNPPPFPDAQYLVPAWTGSSGCSVTSNGVFAGGPCFGANIDDAVIFDCAARAATSSGCETTVASPANATYDYNVTIWYPDSNVTSSDANCEFLPSVGYSTPFQAWCASINQTSFVIAESPP